MTSEDRATRTSRRDSAREAASDARTRASELRIEGLDADADVLDKLVGVLDEVAAGKLRGATTGKLVDNAKKEIARLGVKNPTSKTRELFPSAPSSFEGSFDQGHEEEGESEETLPAYVTSEYVASPRQHQNGAVTVKFACRPLHSPISPRLFHSLHSHFARSPPPRPSSRLP